MKSGAAKQAAQPDLFRASLAQWEKAASEMTQSVMRRPETLAMGTAMLQAQVAWRRAFDAALDACFSGGR